MGNDSIPAPGIIQCKHCITCATEFESADFLKIFAFEKKRGSKSMVDSRTGHNRRAVHKRLNPLSSTKDVIVAWGLIQHISGELLSGI
jgi:hypothetical protein